MTERPPRVIETELDAVRKRLSELESIQKNGAPGSPRVYRRGFSKGLVFGLAPFIGLLLLIGGTLYGQGAGDALFIDPRGWIGIGNNKPNATLDVAGTLNIKDNAVLSSANIKGSLTTGGDVGIGAPNPSAKLEVNGRIKDQTGYVMPVGSIVAYYGARAPDGWLLCDGSAIPNEAKYQDLKALLAKSTTPDLRDET